MSFEKNITAEYLKRTSSMLSNLKQITYDLLDLENQKLLVDVGCGPGIDTIPMAKAIQNNGKIIGVDVDDTMLKLADEEAVRNDLSHIVSHVKASADKLPFQEFQATGIRAERLFQVLPVKKYPPQNIFDELYRVLAQDGIMVLADTDWSTASVDFSDYYFERKMVRFFCEQCRPNGISARQFYRFMQEKKMTKIELVPIPIIMYDLEQCPLGKWLADEALRQEYISEEEAAQWMDELSAKNTDGTFFATGNMYIVKGRK